MLTLPSAMDLTRPFTRNRRREPSSITSRPMCELSCRFRHNGSSGADRAELTSRETPCTPSARRKPGLPSRTEAQTESSWLILATITMGCCARKGTAPAGIWLLKAPPFMRAEWATPARACMASSPA